MLGNLLFVNRNSDLFQWTSKTPPDIFFAPLDLLQDIIEDVEIKIDSGTHDLNCNTYN